MALTFNGGNYITQASALVAAAPMTFSCWVNLTSISANAFIMGIASGTTGHSSYFAMEFITASAKMCAAIKNDAGSTTDVTALTTATLSANTWYHVACVFTSITSRVCYLNGVAGTSSAVSVTPGTCDSSYIGNIKFNAIVSTGAIGAIAFAGIWKVALVAGDILSLSTGCSPRTVVPASLVSYPKSLGDGNSPEPDVVSGSWTLVTG